MGVLGKWALCNRGERPNTGGDNDPIAAWEANLENGNPEPRIAESVNIQNEWDSNRWNSNYWNCWYGNNYWAETPGWGQNPEPPSEGVGSISTGGSRNPVGVWR